MDGISLFWLKGAGSFAAGAVVVNAVALPL